MMSGLSHWAGELKIKRWKCNEYSSFDVNLVEIVTEVEMAKEPT